MPDESDCIQGCQLLFECCCYFASNGLVANPKKTALLFLNLKQEQDQEIIIKIGKEVIERVHSAKLLGITFESSQKWAEDIYRQSLVKKTN